MNKPDFTDYVLRHDLRMTNTWYVEKYEGRWLTGNKSERVHVGSAILSKDGKSFEWSECAAMGFPTEYEATKALAELP